MADIQPGRRLVQQHDRGFLRQHHCDPRALALSAGEGIDALLGQLGDARRLHRALHGLVVLLAPAGKQRLVRIAPAGDQLLHGNIPRRGGVLRQQAIRRATSLLAKRWICSPSRNTLPSTGDIRRLSVRSNVDLPQPFGPIMAVKWPSGMATDKSRAMIFAVAEGQVFAAQAGG